MKIWIVGVGGVGSGIGGQLAGTHDLLFVDGWKEHVDAINDSGLTITYPNGPVTIHAPAVTYDDLQQVADVPEVVLLAVKSYQTDETVTMLRPYLPTHVPVVSLQNCVNEETISRILGVDRTIGGICLYDGALLAPGQASRTRSGGKIIIGELDGSRSTRIDALATALRSGLTVEVSTNIWGLLWSKLVRNVMTNPLAALTGMGNGKLVVNPVTRQLALILGRETVRVATELGYSLVQAELYGCSVNDFLSPLSSDGFKSVEAAFTKEYEAYPNLQPAMLQDVLKGRRTEIDFMNGYVVTKATEAGIDAAGNVEIVRMVKELHQPATSSTMLPRLRKLLDQLIVREEALHAAPNS